MLFYFMCMCVWLALIHICVHMHICAHMKREAQDPVELEE